MKHFFYLAGRAFQLAALIAMPSSIWVGQIGHNERGAIAIFLSSIGVFLAGVLFQRLSRG